MLVVLTGATGFVGGRVADRLLKAGHELRLLGRRSALKGNDRVEWFAWDALAGSPPAESLEGADAVVHLAGEPIAQRWNRAVKQRIRDSRVQGTHHLVECWKHLIRPPRALICASAIGYYGPRGDEILTENSAPGTDFLARVCADWENEARGAAEVGARVVPVRIGPVLGRGGALAQMLPAFRAGLGGRLGSGRQWMSWIHVDDLEGLVLFALERESLRGPVNAVAPGAVTNAQFTQQLGRALHRPTLLPVPGFGLRLLFGEMAGVMLTGQHVLPGAAEAAGYGFAYPELDGALDRALSGAR